MLRIVVIQSQYKTSGNKDLKNAKVFISAFHTNGQSHWPKPTNGSYKLV